MSAPQRVNDKRLSLLRRSVRPRLSNAACLLNFELLENRCVLAATIENFPGLNSPFNPPDPVGDVGPRHYVQMVNATDYQIWDKTGTPLTAPLSLGSLWPLGNVCRTDTGDPIVVYDHIADRWLLSQFANPSHMCIAVSQTANPVAGTWFTYTFNTGVFPDYPKLGVWPDGYYMSSYEGDNLGIYAFERTKMLAGDPSAKVVKQTLPSLGAPGVRNTRILPADLDGPLPPVGTPNYFVRTVDGQQDPVNPVDRLEVYAATPNFVAGTLGFALVNTLAPNAFDIMTCNRNGQGTRDCIPQPGIVDTIDALSNRSMMQLRYRNFGNYQAMVFNQTIDVEPLIPNFNALREVAGIRWYELRKSAANWTIHQQGNYLPQNAVVTAENQLLHRWMGSTAMDGAGNIATAHSITNSNNAAPVFAGARYAGRLASDPIGTLRAEQTIVSGTNAQGDADAIVEPQRWGDYASLSVDPLDDSTFWFTTHLAGAGGVGPRPTRIASFLLNSSPTITVGSGNNTMQLRVSPTNPAQIEFLLDGFVTNTYVLADLTRLTINGGAGTDTLSVSYANGNPIPRGGLVFNGQSGAGDTLRVVSGNFQDIVKTFTNTTDGNVRLVAPGGLTSRTITYTGLSPVLLNVGSVTNVVFNLPPVANPGVIVGDDLGAGANTSQIRGSTFEDTTFTNPTASLTINLGNAGNGITLLTMDPAYAAAATITVNGGDGVDTIVGNGLNNRLFGGRGNDVLTGAGGNDFLTGGLGDDRYVFDTDVASGSDTINESEGGKDTLDFSSTTTRTVTANLSLSAAQVVNAGLTLTLSSPATMENIIGGALNDSLTGNALANRLTGRGGNDSLVGGANNDTYIFDTDSPLGADTIIDTAGDDTLDFSTTSTRSVSVNLGLPVAQVVNAGLSLTLSSAIAIENVIGGSLGDALIGNSLDNTFTGGAGSDSITGASGNDTYVFDTDLALGTDTLDESGGGIDALDFRTTSTRSIAINLGLAGLQVVNAGLSLILTSGVTFEQVMGGNLGDTIVGNSLNNVLLGFAGDDVISGSFGRDLMIGGTGGDTLTGLSGDDLLIAGITIYDSNNSSLRIILNSWTSANPYLTRINTLRAGVSGVRLQTGGVGRTVLTDGVLDTLTGGVDNDWFIRAATDNITDLALGEIFDLM